MNFQINISKIFQVQNVILEATKSQALDYYTLFAPLQLYRILKQNQYVPFAIAEKVGSMKTEEALQRNIIDTIKLFGFLVLFSSKKSSAFLM